MRRGEIYIRDVTVSNANVYCSSTSFKSDAIAIVQSVESGITYLHLDHPYSILTGTGVTDWGIKEVGWQISHVTIQSEALRLYTSSLAITVPVTKIFLPITRSSLTWYSLRCMGSSNSTDSICQLLRRGSVIVRYVTVSDLVNFSDLASYGSDDFVMFDHMQAHSVILEDRATLL